MVLLAYKSVVQRRTPLTATLGKLHPERLRTLTSVRDPSGSQCAYGNLTIDSLLAFMIGRTGPYCGSPLEYSYRPSRQQTENACAPLSSGSNRPKIRSVSRGRASQERNTERERQHERYNERERERGHESKGALEREKERDTERQQEREGGQ